MRARTHFFKIALFLISLAAGGAVAQPPPENSAPILVGYFGQWSVYDHFLVKNLVSSGAAAQLDQINYAQGSVAGGHCGIADPNADLNLTFAAADSVNGVADNPASAFRGDLHQLAELKKRFPHLKVLISLEGRGADFALDAQPENRSAFVASCIDRFIRGHFAPGAEDATLFDGIDLDWEYPNQEDAANFIELLTQLREAMDSVRPGLRLAVAVGPSPQMYPGVSMAALSHIVDQIGVMNYDYNGPWNPRTGFLAPLYAEKGGSVERSIADYREAGVPVARLLMGMPFYGYGWQQVSGEGHGLFQTGLAIHGDRPYSFLETLLSAGTPTEAGNRPGETTANLPEKRPTSAATAFTIYRDPRSQAPWLYDGDTFWTFDDPTSIRFKAQFAVGQQLGGMMAWELSEDTANATLLRAARAGLNQSPNQLPAQSSASPARWPDAATPAVAQTNLP